MSKNRPSKVFEVIGASETVTVIARHPKGARTVAAQEIDGVTIKSTVNELPGHMEIKAVNFRKGQADACA